MGFRGNETRKEVSAGSGLAEPASGKAGFAPRLAIGHHRPGLPEPGRSAKTMRCLSLSLLVLLLLAGCSVPARITGQFKGPHGDAVVIKKDGALLPRSHHRLNSALRIPHSALKWSLIEIRTSAFINPWKQPPLQKAIVHNPVHDP